MRIIAWNCRRATASSALWDYFSELDPDLALLQEVGGLPHQILDRWNIVLVQPVGKAGRMQAFHTGILVRGEVGEAIRLQSDLPWVQAELDYFSGNLLGRRVQPENGPPLLAISVYAPAWPIPQSRVASLDTSAVRLTHQKASVWVADILWSALRSAAVTRDPWVAGGDFNLSETFDMWWGLRPRGNREYLDRMAAAGFVECLRESRGVLTPTFRNPKGGALVHQMDHLFVSGSLIHELAACDVGSADRVFGTGLSDHLPLVADFHAGT